MKKQSDTDLRKQVRGMIKEYNSTGYGHNPTMDALVEAAKRWYDLKPLPDDVDVATLTEEQMRELLKKDDITWREPITKELVRRGYLQAVYHEVYYIGGDGDENTFLVLFKEDDFDVNDAVMHYIGKNIRDGLFSPDLRDSHVHGGETSAWIKDGVAKTVIDRLKKNPAFSVTGETPEHFYTRYHCSVDGASFDLFQTFKKKIAVVVKHVKLASLEPEKPATPSLNKGAVEIGEPFEIDEPSADEKNKAWLVLRETFPEAFKGNRRNDLMFTKRTEIDDSFVAYS